MYVCMYVCLYVTIDKQIAVYPPRKPLHGSQCSSLQEDDFFDARSDISENEIWLPW